MKYGYQKLKGICEVALSKNLCLGCNLLELENFNGKEHCELVKNGRNECQRILERIKNGK